jgi:hypothetical protein
MYIKPTPGITVPDPDRGDTLPVEGREVQATQYWQRRLNDGDVLESAPLSPPALPTVFIPSNKKES